MVQRMLRQSHVEMTMHYVHNSSQARNAQAEFIERFLPNGNWEASPGERDERGKELRVQVRVQ